MDANRTVFTSKLSWISLVFVLCMKPYVAAAQEEGATSEVGDVNPQIWVDYNPSILISSNTELYGDVGVRRQLESGGWWRFIARPGLRHCLAKGVCFAGGIGSFYRLNQTGSDRWEIRPFQGVSATWPNWRVLPLRHYLRIEERVEFNTQSWTSDVSLRLRYRLMTSLRWEEPVQPDRYWSLLGSLEGFASLMGGEGQVQEEFRATVGVERSFRPGLRLRGEVALQQRGLFFFVEDSVSDLYIRIRFFQRWGQR